MVVEMSEMERTKVPVAKSCGWDAWSTQSVTTLVGFGIFDAKREGLG